MPSGIFLLHNDGDLTEMAEESYSSEDLLQGLLEKYPNLLAGDQIDESEPRRWLLVKREVSIPDKEFVGGRWSCDHLFLDQDGIPTLVEVKRSTDTRIRREVIGQMLDYAANAVAYWSLEKVQAELEKQLSGQETDPETLLLDFLGPGSNPEEFWRNVKTNLQAGRIRMVFVADIIPPELRRVVEFLNEQMDPAEVLAVEIRKFEGKGQTALIPRVYGLTSAAQVRKKVSLTETRQWDEESFMADLASNASVDVLQVARDLLQWARDHGCEIWWGKGRTLGGFVPILVVNGVRHQLFEVWSSGLFETFFQHWAKKPPFQEERQRREILDRFSGIPGVNLPADSVEKRPSIPLKAFTSPPAWEALMNLLNWMVEEIRRTG
jgi:hypothetical protein